MDRTLKFHFTIKLMINIEQPAILVNFQYIQFYRQNVQLSCDYDDIIHQILNTNYIIIKSFN